MMIHRDISARKCVLLLAQLTLLVSIAKAAEFQQTPAVLCQPRAGLGNVLEKLAAGKDVRIGYFGGSITAANGWRPKTLAWFQQQFPKATISEINAAIGGTGSDLGVFRYQQDVLQHKPDLVFVEFSVNDSGAQPEDIYRCMEGIVRQTWRADPTTDLCFVYTFVVGFAKDLSGGLCPRSASADEHLAEYYGIPAINVALRIAQMGEEGKVVFQAAPNDNAPALAGKTVFSNDGVHPLDAGHDVYAQVISEAILERIQGHSKPGPHELKTPFRADNWEKAKLVPIDQKMLHGSWKVMDRQQGLGSCFSRQLPIIWEGTTPGDRIEFRFKGTMVGLYDLVGPDGGQLVWSIDGKANGPTPRFDSYCTYHRLASLRIAGDLEDKEHSVTLEIHPDQPDRSSVVDRIRNEPNFEPKSYEGTKAWIGYLMMIGEPID